MLNEEHKYILLLSAKLGGHKIDCIPIEYCDVELLRARETANITELQPLLNIAIPGERKDITDLKIDDLLETIKKIKGEL
jgi:hypothetical protein